jgi:uncharacterized repeat protein (TIGR01451 family)
MASPLGPNTGVALSPSQVIAPVGSEVIMIASVAGGEGYLLTNERVEWTLAPDGVGQFLSPGARRRFDLVSWARGLPRKVNSQYAINSTLFLPMTLDRGTPTPYDDILVQGGQAWVSVMSPIEGTSRVTAFVPAVSGWDRQQQTALIYWIDAQWRFPAPAISAAGTRNTLTTVLTRQTNNTPLVGWPLRYEITGGPAAGFAPDGATSVEVITNEAGQASAEIVQTQPAPGTNQISIQVIRPPAPGDQNQALTVGSGSTLQTWAAADASGRTIEPQPAAAAPAAPAPLAPAPGPAPTTPTPAPLARADLDVIVSGPLSATVGDNVQFQIQVTNRGANPATKLVVTDRFDAGLEHVAATSPIERDLIDLQPGAAARLTVNFRIARAGELCQNIEVTGAGGLKGTARHCLTASPPSDERSPGDERWEPQPPPAAQDAPARPPGEQPPSAETPRAAARLSVRKTGPDRRLVGETALFTIEVTNRGEQPLEDVVIADNFETSLEPQRATEDNEWFEGGAIGWKVGTLAPGTTARRDIEFKCLRETPRACNRVTVTAKNLEPVADEACFEIVGGGAEAAAPSKVTRQPLSVTVADTTDPVRVNGKTTFQILIENPAPTSYFDVVVRATISDELHVESIGAPAGTEGSILNNSVRFTPIRELRPGEPPLSFELQTTARRAGAAGVRVEVTSRGQAQPVVAEHATQVIP